MGAAPDRARRPPALAAWPPLEDRPRWSRTRSSHSRSGSRNYALWHIPAVYDAALRHPHSLLALEHATYVLTGVTVWWPVFQDVPRRLQPARALYVFAAFVLSAPLGLVLALVPDPIYDFYVDAPERLWGLSRSRTSNSAG